MKRETKVIIMGSVCAIALLLVPVLFAKVRADREAELIQREPGRAALKFRDAVRGATQIRVFLGVGEAGSPGNAIPANQKPAIVLTGEEVTTIVRTLHFQWVGGVSEWHKLSGPFPGSIGICTALEFCSDDKKLADLRVGTTGGERVGARWYAPPGYIGDSCLLIESRDYLERKLNCRLDGR